LSYLILAIVTGGMDRDPACGRVDRNLHWMLECGTLLYQAVAQEPEVTALGEDSSLVVERAILEVKHQPAGHPIATGDLDQVTIGESVTRQCAQHQKTMHQALWVAYGYRCRPYFSWVDQRGADHQNAQRGAPDTFYRPTNHK